MSSKFNLLIFLLALGLMVSCGDSKPKDEQLSLGDYQSTDTQTEAAAPETSSDSDPLLNKGVGPVTHITLGDLDPAQAATGKELFGKLCTA